MKKLTIIFLALFLLTGLVGNLYSLTENSETKKAVVAVKYIDILSAHGILKKFLSPRGEIRFARHGNRVIIEDVPEVVDKLLSILREIDVKPVDLQFSAELILGSMELDEKKDLDKELMSDPVIKELRNLLKYRSFKRLDSSIIKVQDNSWSSQRMGSGEISLRLLMRPRYIKEEKVDTFQVKLELRQQRGINKEGKEIVVVLIETTLTLKSGERTAVGVSKLDGGDKALILIVSGKVIG